MLYLVVFGIFIYILVKTLKFDDIIKNLGKTEIEMPIKPIELVYKNIDYRMANYLNVNYEDNKLEDEKSLRIKKIDNNENIIEYVNNNINTVGIINELELESNSHKKSNLRFMCAPQKLVLFFLLQYYQKDDYISKVNAIINPEDPENMLKMVEKEFEIDSTKLTKVEIENLKNKLSLRNKLDRIYRLNLENFETYIKEDQRERLKDNKNTGIKTKPYIIALDSEDTLSERLFKTISIEMKWKISEYNDQVLNNDNTNIIFYKKMPFEKAIIEFIKSSDSVDSLFYLRDERDWKVKELFVNYYEINKKAPIIVEVNRNEKTKGQLKKTFIHMIDTSLYYTNKSVGGDEGTEDESLQIRLPTIAIRNLLFCNVNTDNDVILLITALCIQNLKYLQQYMFPGCKNSDKQMYLAKEMNDLEAKISELSLTLTNDDKIIQYEQGQTLNKLIDRLEEEEKKYIKIARECEDRIPINPFPNLDEIVFCFPSQKVHPVSKEYFHNNGLYTRNSKYEYDLDYYAKKVKQYYTNLKIFKE